MVIKSIVSKCKGYATLIVWLLALMIIAGLLLSFERYVLWKIQEQNLFLDTSLFFRQQMVVPGGLLTYVGSFLTQLLYYPVLGVSVLCIWWGLLMELMRRTFRVGEPWAMLLLVPVALLLMANVQMGYWIYPIKLKGWYFDATIGFTVIVALLWAYRVLSARRLWRRLLLVLTAVVGYPLVGTYALVAVLLMALWSWRLDEKHSQTIIDSILAVLLVVVIPLLGYQFVYYQTNKVNLWWTGLPTFKILETNSSYYVPYALLGVCLVILVLAKWPKPAVKQAQADARNESQERKQARQKGKRKKASTRNYKGLWQKIVVGAILIATAFATRALWMKDENFHREVVMEYFAEQTRWEDVLKVAAKQQDTPTRAIVLMRNLALSRLGRQNSEMYSYPNGSKAPDCPFPIPTSLLVGNMIYYHYGMMNDCHHMCIEAGVEYNWRVENLKYMARCALIDNEVSSLYKYTNLLKHTMFHGEWARRIENLQQQPKLKREDKETGPIMHMLQYPDIVGSDHGQTEKYVMNILSQMDSDDPIFQEQCLLAALWAKRSSLFWPRFAKYLSQHPGEPIPRYYQEAAYLYSTIEQSAPFEVPVDDSVKMRLQNLMELLPRYDGMDLKEVRPVVYPMYGDSYFFEYFLMGDLSYL